ncbi:hypothetical protein [Sphingobacterium pedocola]|uniref:Uncharacterized protein n=1 Tax=Sphingobacterium pedocola TaxID=2082722 RepID=A0ABR9T9J6_9SPHI|nr:hypothetical protein [Sphingobacterium pedocola]MBE8722025.1 hypothetical protein [Sphingobacterium pedocola]
MKRKQLNTIGLLGGGILIVAGLFYLILRTETYGCVIQFIDANDTTKVFTVRGKCRNDSSTTEQNRWFENALYDLDTFSTE